jgi:hypothetical protein
VAGADVVVEESGVPVLLVVRLKVAADKLTEVELVVQAKRVFISYSHRDSRYRNELMKHLTPLHREGLLAAWHDKKISGGEDWQAQISEHLLGADIILLLVSADFLDSDYCYRSEMKAALRRHEAGEARVIPVIVRDVDWRNGPLAKLQALPINRNGQLVPIGRWASQDAAWLSVILDVRRTLMS